ncbi:hypothetical protein ABZ135_21245 [Streptomyces sp. NPDC006339]|uniref:hypothetical protein n=1 Tax=Streptomyces sp. NPDC006339 TaxID=3156755 RepID=UPI0033A848BF
MKDFELLDVSLYTEELGRLEVPLEETGNDREGPEPLALPEGAVVSVGLTFRLGREIDGVAFEDSRVREGAVLGSTRTVLGGFRAGGPYEVRLPAERLPVGRAHCGIYEVTGRFTDGEGHELALEHHRVRVDHQPAAHKRYVGDPPAPDRPPTALHKETPAALPGETPAA